MITLPIRVRRQDLAIGVVAALCVLGFLGVAARMTDPGFPLDDAWIHQTYARNLAQRGEWAFIPGAPSAASTSPLYTVLLAIGYVLRINYFVWAFLLGGVALACAGWLSARLAAHLFPTLRQVGLWSGLAVVTTWQLVWAAVSGMETLWLGTLGLALVGMAWRCPLIGAEQVTRSGVARHGLLLGLLGASVTLTRPEGVLLVALAGMLVGVGALSRGGAVEWRQVVWWGTAFASGWGIGVLPYLLLNYRIEGAVLPATSAAKQAEYAATRQAALLVRYGRLLLSLSVGGQIMLIPGMAVGLGEIWRRARRDRRQVVLLLPAAWAFALVTVYAVRLPVTYQHGRYLMPALPHLVLYGVGGTLVLVRAARRRRVWRVLSRALALAAVAIVPGFLMMGARQYGADVRIINTEMVATARWVQAELSPEDLLAVHDIGALGYFAPRPMLDLAGLISPEVVPIIREGEALMALMCARGVRYLMAFPDQRPVPADDPRLGAEPVFVTGAPYAPAAGGGNMAVYALQWPAECRSP